MMDWGKPAPHSMPPQPPEVGKANGKGDDDATSHTDTSDTHFETIMITPMSALGDETLTGNGGARGHLETLFLGTPLPSPTDSMPECSSGNSENVTLHAHSPIRRVIDISDSEEEDFDNGILPAPSPIRPVIDISDSSEKDHDNGILPLQDHHEGGHMSREASGLAPNERYGEALRWLNLEAWECNDESVERRYAIKVQRKGVDKDRALRALRIIVEHRNSLRLREFLFSVINGLPLTSNSTTRRSIYPKKVIVDSDLAHSEDTTESFTPFGKKEARRHIVHMRCGKERARSAGYKQKQDTKKSKGKPNLAACSEEGIPDEDERFIERYAPRVSKMSKPQQQKHNKSVPVSLDSDAFQMQNLAVDAVKDDFIARLKKPRVRFPPSKEAESSDQQHLQSRYPDMYRASVETEKDMSEGTEDSEMTLQEAFQALGFTEPPAHSSSILQATARMIQKYPANISRWCQAREVILCSNLKKGPLRISSQLKKVASSVSQDGGPRAQAPVEDLSRRYDTVGNSSDHPVGEIGVPSSSPKFHQSHSFDDKQETVIKQQREEAPRVVQVSSPLTQVEMNMLRGPHPQNEEWAPLHRYDTIDGRSYLGPAPVHLRTSTFGFSPKPPGVVDCSAAFSGIAPSGRPEDHGIFAIPESRLDAGHAEELRGGHYPPHVSQTQAASNGEDASKERTVTYMVQIKAGNNTVFIPIDEANVSGREKAVATTSMQKVWKWVQDKKLGDKITLQDTYDLATEMHEQGKDNSADPKNMDHVVLEPELSGLDQAWDGNLAPPLTPPLGTRGIDDDVFDRGFALPPGGRTYNDDDCWGFTPRMAEGREQGKNSKDGRGRTNSEHRGWNNDNDDNDFGFGRPETNHDDTGSADGWGMWGRKVRDREASGWGGC
ncbi:hypothetical protein K491DRAFT_129930 [Lophiostoma macrostomum CBS 122681]|uniref:UCH repeated domain-containing protein n=1 Tax=Lophiostoma macrostomum CBS 122681 TaxID=1314788 RepID=A0A6A6SSG9_9PLEO|nr:hypothetical protein K491DRAFT_129930 [Lophiostoma macrostomum CBS 122681]